MYFKDLQTWRLRLILEIKLLNIPQNQKHCKIFFKDLNVVKLLRQFWVLSLSVLESIFWGFLWMLSWVCGNSFWELFGNIKRLKCYKWYKKPKLWAWKTFKNITSELHLILEISIKTIEDSWKLKTGVLLVTLLDSFQRFKKL